VFEFDDTIIGIGAITPERETPPVSGSPSIPRRKKLPFHHFSRSGLSRQLPSQVYTGSVGAENFPYFVAHAAKNSENLFFTSRSFGRIVKAPVVPFHHPGKYRTRLVGVSTDRDHRVHFLIQEFLEVLRTVTRNVDPNLSMARIAKG
jgi:hypothetical protein